MRCVCFLEWRKQGRMGYLNFKYIPSLLEKPQTKHKKIPNNKNNPTKKLTTTNTHTKQPNKPKQRKTQTETNNKPRNTELQF